MDCQINQQRKCGLIGGLSYLSTLDYYNIINELVNKFWPGHSSRIHIISLDLFQQTYFLEHSEWSKAADYILDGVHQLVETGIDFLLIASNTGHIAVPEIMKTYPNLVLIHISDAVAFAIKQKKLKKIGFLGTIMAMKMDSCVVDRLIKHNLDIVFPNEEDMKRVHHIIAMELSNNILTDESRQTYMEIIQRLHEEQHVEGVVLGCTEIPLLINQGHIPHIPLFNSTQLHAQLAVDYQLGRCDIQMFLPSNN